MKNTNRIFTSILLTLVLMVMAFSPVQQALAMPVTGDAVAVQSPAFVTSGLSSLSDFVATVKNGKSGQIVGLYADGVFALKVVQQPSGDSSYVSTASSEVVTQFGMASSYGSIGMLAHNYLAGKYFTSLSSGSKIIVIYGDGKTVNYKVSAIRQYQALSPNSVKSNFVDLSKPDKTLTSSDVFKQTYGNKGALVLQTCISKDGNSSWGRLFVIAYKE
jgi:hypothetical protein